MSDKEYKKGIELLKKTNKQLEAIDKAIKEIEGENDIISNN